MSEAKNTYSPTTVSPPGSTLADVLAERGMTQAELAKRLGRPLKTVNEIIKGKAAITPDTALQLETVLKIPAGFWLNREQAYREFLARQASEQLRAAEIAWLKEVPVADLIKKGWVKKAATKAAQVWECLQFFGVASVAQWRSLYSNPQVAYRRSSAFKSSPGAIAAWLRAGELEAQRIVSAPFSEPGFREVLKKARALTVLPPGEFEEKLEQMCAGAGVAVVFVPETKGSCASGVTRWLSPSKALIQLSLRYNTDDSLWFTFFHEAGHVLLHGKKEVFLEGCAGTGIAELEANKFASDLLIPSAEFKALVAGNDFSEAAVRAFAAKVGVAPGIVVGRLHHEELLPYWQMRDLKRPLRLVEKPALS